MTARAKYATARTPGNRTMGGRVGVVSEALGAPFMPWQRQVADVACELHPTIPGAWRYRLVIVTVPRQSGKTTLMRAVAVDRAVSKPDQQVFVTAQTGKDARARWRDWVTAIESPTCPLAGVAQVRKAAGSEALSFPNRSFVSPFAPTPKSLHGYTPPLVMVDEGWAFDQPSGSDLEAAISPAQITLVDRQLWIVSTMGDADSHWFHALVEAGRAATGDPSSDIAYFEWSADEDADPYAPETLDFHPAVGHTQTRDDLLAQSVRESPGNWARGYLNLRTSTSEAVIDLARWDDLAPETQHDPPALGECVIGYAVADDRSGSSVWAAHVHAGRPCAHLVATRAGSSWVAPTVADLHARGVRKVTADDSGHTRTVTATLDTLGVKVATLPTSEYVTACASLLGHVTDGTVAHDGSPELRSAVEVAALRNMGGGRGFDDRTSAGPIDHLKAATAALFVAEHLPTAVPIF